MTDALRLRPVEPAEHPQALDLWRAVFGATPGYFERYYDADPEYRPGDTWGVWDGGQLVSAVHLCRRRAAWKGVSLLCGGIANVATLPDFRRRGLSRLLLRQMIAKMEAENFDYALLATGTHAHYAALGWETVERPQATLDPAPAPPQEATWGVPQDTALPQSLYSLSPRPLQFERPPLYFDRWVGWDWREPETTLLTWPGLGYAVLAGEGGEAATLKEWRAVDEASERALLQAASEESHRRGQTCLWVEALPQYGGLALLGSLGSVEAENDDCMIRRIHLSPADYEEVRAAYATGTAAWWPADGF